jgi:hypothetical protein
MSAVGVAAQIQPDQVITVGMWQGGYDMAGHHGARCEKQEVVFLLVGK